MPYAALSDVNALCPQAPFTANTLPNDTQVGTILASVSLQIDSTLSQLYVTPIVSGDASLSMLTDICAWGALGRAQEARNTGVVAELAGTKSVWTKKFEEALAALADPDNPFILPDAPRNADFVEKMAGEIVDGTALTEPFGPHDWFPHLGRPHVGQIF